MRKFAHQFRRRLTNAYWICIIPQIEIGFDPRKAAANQRKHRAMQPEYDFSKAKRAKNVPHLTKLRASMKGKTRITIMLDDDVIKTFRDRAEERGIGYQTAINEALRAAAGAEDVPVTVKILREVLHKELRSR